ncbi:hypothetical protein [Actinomadura sp. CNU-125]|uniref:hypothetical protein n=1 Tax=Actinomadura sp. CNU-125 TaxID=1904961 RepID=UPI001177CF97|nr:hypothetical protein [Actinomadura sp. CNU-125]
MAVAEGGDQWCSHYYLHDDPLEETGGWPGWLEQPYPGVDIGPCQACGRSTKRYHTWRTSRGTVTGFACVWCRADVDVFHTGPPGHVPVPTRPYYAPPDMRWDEAIGGTPRRRHASGHWGLTLCGLSAAGLTDHGVQWTPGHADACPACRTAADEIDARWPADRRVGGTFLVACPCPACRRAGTGTDR